MKVDVTSISFRSLAACPCERCGGDVEMLQPDANAPDNLLSVCPACGHWALAHISIDGETLHLISLLELRQALEKTAGALEAPAEP